MKFCMEILVILRHFIKGFEAHLQQSCKSVTVNSAMSACMHISTGEPMNEFS
jgi:hypothetical protein